MGLNKSTRMQGTFATVIADGSVRVKGIEGEEGVVERKITLKDGSTMVKWEHVYNDITGRVTSIQFNDGDYGKSIWVTVSSDVDIILSLNVESEFASDVMKKLPNIEFMDEVKFQPYSFVDEKGKKRKGMTVIQGENKIKSFFVDENNKSINGFPEVEEGKTYDSSDWKVYFINVWKFLVDYTEKNTIPKLVASLTSVAGEINDNGEVTVTDPGVGEIPF